MERPFDIIVAGAGPAGSSCARRAAELGLSVVVLEKDRLPRVKHCAAGLSARSLSRVGAAAGGALHREFREIELVVGDRTTLVWTAAETLIATTTRLELDAALAEGAASAGAKLVFATRVEGVEASGDGVAVAAGGRTWAASFLVAADGATGTSRSFCGVGAGPVSGAAYVNAFPPAGREGILERSKVTFDLRGTRRGYGWVFPRRDHLNVGVYSQRPLSRALIDDLRAFVSSRGLDAFGLEGPFAFPLPAGPRGWRRSSGRVLFAGDAAGLADPVTGEGICHAVESGRAAAEVVAAALRSGGNAGTAYERRVSRSIVPEVTLLSVMGNAFYSLGSRASDRVLSASPVRAALIRLGPWRKLGSGTGRLAVVPTPAPPGGRSA